MRGMIIFVLAVLVLAFPALAQEQTGMLHGKVSDSSGVVLPGVPVTIRAPTIGGGSMRNIPIGT